MIQGELSVCLSVLCVRLRELRVKIGLSGNPEHFNAEAGEEDAEFAEEKQSLFTDKTLSHNLAWIYFFRLSCESVG